MMRRCLYCYKPLAETDNDFHAACSKKMFGDTRTPLLPYTENDLEKMAEEVIRSHTSVTGVQPKLSLHLTSGKDADSTKRFTIAGLWGGFILKPPTPHYPQLPEVEDLTMHLAEVVKIKTVPHSLIRLQSGNLAYVTKRIDRINKTKLHMEDMCQLTERLTENKYQGSYEQIAKAIQKYSSHPGLDVVNFFESVVFSFITGNADMHLKNFSLIRLPNVGVVLSPAYDLVSTTLVNPADKEETALNLNGKKHKIKKSDFINAFTTLKLEKKQQLNILNKMLSAEQAWMDLIKMSFISEEFKEKYIHLIKNRLEIFK